MTTIYVIRNTLKTGRLERFKLEGSPDSLTAHARDQQGNLLTFRGNDWWYDRKLACNEVYARRRKRLQKLRQQIEKLNKMQIRAPREDAP